MVESRAKLLVGKSPRVQMGYYPRLIVFSYLDVEIALKQISRLSKRDRKVVLESERGFGAALYFTGKSQMFKLGNILSQQCI